MPNSTPDSIEGASGSSTLHEIQIDEDIGVDGLPSDLDADVEKRVQVSEEQSELGPKIVDWDGPDDPENGINWPIKKKWRIVLLISVFTFISYGHFDISSIVDQELNLIIQPTSFIHVCTRRT